MASYFVAYDASPVGEVAVHDRTRCPPGCFLGEALTEYLGEFLEATQAVAVARLRYGHARGCPACEPARVRASVLPSIASA
ncbi:MAG TPA: hypothetical protein VFM98_10305 [Ramlibacter sp.]|uniref:hypothetical protein n=1 Tax=Ramlibacter sp. TaxID=1917967 RepID=UPI002D80AA53|nr:hypothetical protein [Ramlibacter sp.]HET8745988.1 hypothetical protein [Ramlibacter sp.]